MSHHTNGNWMNDDQRDGGHHHVLIGRCHPEANGGKPKFGDVAWTLQIPLQHGETLILKLGKKGRDLLFGMLIADCQDSGEPEPHEQAEPGNQ